MSKQWPDWSDLMKGKVGEAEHPLSKSVTVGPVLKKGEVPRRPSDGEIREYILKGMPVQPTNEQLFGHLAVSEERANEARENWENQFTKFFRTRHEPVEKSVNNNWGMRGPIDQNDESQLTEEEKRILAIPVNPNAR